MLGNVKPKTEIGETAISLALILSRGLQFWPNHDPMIGKSSQICISFHDVVQFRAMLKNFLGDRPFKKNSNCDVYFDLSITETTAFNAIIVWGQRRKGENIFRPVFGTN